MVKEISKLKRSQSMMKDLERKDGCPYKWYHNWVKKEIPRDGSELMDYGRYFETLVIGGSARGDALHELPLTKTGKKTANQERIDEQARYALEMLHNKNHKDYLSIDVLDTQIKLYDKDINFEGVLDISGRYLDGRAVIADLKLTSDIDATYGPYPWGDLDRIDFIQMILYSYLYKKTYNESPEVLYLLFDFSPKMGKKVIDLTLDDYDIEDMMDRIESFEEALNHYSKNGFVKYPSLKECDKCPFDKIGCDQYFRTDDVKYIKFKT
jgi:hypothetical protein